MKITKNTLKRSAQVLVLVAIMLVFSGCARGVKTVFCPIVGASKTITVGASSTGLVVVTPNIQECDSVSLQNNTPESLTAIVRIFGKDATLIGQQKINIPANTTAGPITQIVDLGSGQQMIIVLNSILGITVFTPTINVANR